MLLAGWFPARKSLFGETWGFVGYLAHVLPVLIASHAGRVRNGCHTRLTTLADDVMGAGRERFRTASRKLDALLRS